MIYHSYELCGLGIQSEIELPELFPAPAPPQVVVRRGSLPARLPGATFHGVLFEATEAESLVTAQGVARYLVSRGEQIVVDASPSAPPEAVRLFLLGAAVGLALTQRGQLGLHASAAVAPDGGAVVLAGFSGSGKSTLLASLVQRGFRMLADDLVVLTPGPDGCPLVQPAIPRLKLKTDAVHRLGWSSDHLVRVRPTVEKFQIPVIEEFERVAQPLRAVFLLTYGSETSLSDVTGRGRVSALRPFVFGQRMAEHFRLHVRQFAMMTAAANCAPVRVLSRPLNAPVESVVTALVRSVTQS